MVLDLPVAALIDNIIWKYNQGLNHHLEICNLSVYHNGYIIVYKR